MQELEGEAVRARNARQDKVERELRAHPMRRYAVDLADVPLKAAPGAPLSVVLAVRHGEQILSGEILIPRERWDFGAFQAILAPAAPEVPS
jgi:hypothetical protein